MVRILPRFGLAALALLPTTALAQGPLDAAATVLREEFSNPSRRDAARSTADWGASYSGALLPGAGGGFGVHGDLRVESGVRVIDVSTFFFPPAQTLSGTSLGPIGGAYYFQSIHVARGATLVLTGTHGARIYAAEIDIQGTLDVSGESAPLQLSKNDPCPLSTVFPWISNETGRGGEGGRGGPGGTAGGSGGDDPRPIGPAPGGMPANPGSTLRVQPQHVGGEDGSGLGAGGGSAAWPDTRISSLFQFRLANVQITPILNYCLQRAGGGGGGSFGALGSPGQDEVPFSGPGGAAGLGVNPDPSLPPGAGRGGFGGGGAGVHPYFTNSIANRFSLCQPSYPAGQRPQIGNQDVIEVWNTGGGGGGGGGYLFLQCDNLQLDGVLAANGGNGASTAAFNSTLGGTEAGSAGGGGSGGAIRLDLLRNFQVGVGASLQVLGGRGGRSSLRAAGGDGGHGLVHARVPSGASGSSLLAATQPAAAFRAQPLQGSDGHPFSFATSRWYRSQAVGRPILDAVITFAIPYVGGAVDPTDPTRVFFLGIPASQLPAVAPCYLVLQSAVDGGAGVPVPGSESRWTFDPTRLNPNHDLFRFAILIDSVWFAPRGPIAGIDAVELLAR